MAYAACRRAFGVVHDPSRGGMGLRLAAGRATPPRVMLAGRAKLSVLHDGDVPFTFGGSIVRLDRRAQSSIGLSFDELSEANQRLFGRAALPPPAGAIRIHFGL